MNDIDYMMDGINFSLLNAWEKEFFESISSQFKEKGKLTARQVEVLEGIWIKQQQRQQKQKQPK